jgi:3-deoxy-D-manno-octulosonic-acid transferase
MYWLYSLGLGGFLVAALPGFLLQAIRHGKYRRGLAERLGGVAPWSGARAPLWLHAVSVGEVMAAAPLARELRARHPEIPLLASTVTETGRGVAEERLPASRFVFFPLDFGWLVERMLERLRPRLVLLTETELWPNFLRACARREIPVVVVNGRISPRSFPRYRLVRRWFGRVLRDVRLFCMQSEADAERILGLGALADRVRVVGNLKYDLPALAQVPDVGGVRHSLDLAPDEPLIVGGSTHRGEEDLLLEAFARLRQVRPDACLLLAPRHPERLEEVERVVRHAGLAVVRRSQLPAQPRGGAPVILLDTMGELALLYAAATAVFIGGSLIPHGGQNILEPAAHARPVLHGPYMGNFAEMRDLFQAAGAAIQVEDGPALERQLELLVRDPARTEQMGKAGQGIVEAHRGATRRTADLVDTLL